MRSEACKKKKLQEVGENKLFIFLQESGRMLRYY